MKSPTVKGLLLTLACLCSSLPAVANPGQPLDSFDREIQPLLSRNQANPVNCQQIQRSTIILSRSTAIFAQPYENLKIGPETAPYPTLLKLAAPLHLTEGCVLGQTDDARTPIEAQIETTGDETGLIIKTQSIIVDGHYLPLFAQSNVIPFERHMEPDTGGQQNNPLCDALGILPNFFVDPYEMGASVSPQELSRMTGSFCKLLVDQPSYSLQAELNAGSFYNFRLSGIQSIPVPLALRQY